MRLAIWTLALTASMNAATIGYSDRATFLAQRPAWTNIDFDAALGALPIAVFNSASGLTVDGVNFVSYRTLPGPLIQYRLAMAPPSTCCGTAPNASTALYLAWTTQTSGIADAIGTTVIQLPSNTHAAGFDFINNLVVDGTLQPHQFDVSDGSSFSGTANLTPQFFGVVSTTPISSIVISMPLPTIPNSRLAIDNFVFDAETPEPSGVFLTALGVCALVGLRAKYSTLP